MTEFAYVWEFRVAPEHVAEFERAYGPDGDWAALFRTHAGYRRTELLRDADRAGRYLTVDYWRSRTDWEDFRRQHARAFVDLDERCGRWTLSETPLGDYLLR